jgi:hypothetical protein
MKKPPLFVFTGKALVGTLARSDVEADTFLFGYRQGTAVADAVSLTMPIRADQYDSMAGLLPVFEMNLPKECCVSGCACNSQRPFPSSMI